MRLVRETPNESNCAFASLPRARVLMCHNGVLCPFTGHMYLHRQKAENKTHQLALHLHSLNIWCYACSCYINIQEDFATRHPNLHALLDVLTKQKLAQMV